MAKIREDLIESKSGKLKIKTKNNVCHISKYLTSGGMAQIFLGKYNGQKCVIKTPKESPETNEREFKQQNKYIEREYIALSKLKHQNIVKSLDFGAYGGENYLIEEFLEGQTLEEYQDNPLSENDAKKIILQIAKTIEFMHTNGFLHRDLSPDNVMENKMSIKLFDFGLAIDGFNNNNEDVVDVKRTRGGHAYFSAFEQYNEGLATPTGDVYSIGTLFWFLLTGKWPTEWGDFSPMVDVDVSEAINDTVLIATKKDWKERYQNVGEFIWAVEHEEPHSAILRGGVINIEGINYPIRKKYTIIGRTGENSKADINVKDPHRFISRCIPSISPRRKGHCKIIRENDRYYLEDLNSENGTWVLFDQSKKEWKRIGRDLPPRIIMNDGDVFTFAYSKSKGHYLTFTFRNYGK